MLDARPMFTVIIPVYNRADIIGRAIHSVLNQRYQDFEILVIDDGSYDNPKDTIDSFSDPRIRYIKQENKGAGAARNTGVQNANGLFVAFLDSDDVWLDHHLSEALPILQSRDNICIYGQVTVDRGNGISFIKPPRGLKPGEDISEYLLCDRGFFPTCSVILPTDLAKTALYDEKVIYGDDVDLAIKIAKSGGSFHFMPGTPPSAIWHDIPNPSRQSMHIEPELIESWLTRMKGLISKRADLGCRGWSVARGYAERGQWCKALSLYAQAALYGCYSPKMMIVVFLQVIMPRNIYRTFSDTLAKIGIKP